MYAYVEALVQVFTLGSKEPTTSRDTKFNQARHPMPKSGLDETIYLIYMEEVEEGYDHTVNELVENNINFCQNNTIMSERKIKEWGRSGPARVLIDKTHKYLICLLEYICKTSRAERASYNVGPGMATLKHYNSALLKIRNWSCTRCKILLKNYILLQEASKLKWQDPKITVCLWKDVRETTELARLCGRPFTPTITPNPQIRSRFGQPLVTSLQKDLFLVPLLFAPHFHPPHNSR